MGNCDELIYILRYIIYVYFSNLIVYAKKAGCRRVNGLNLLKYLSIVQILYIFEIAITIRWQGRLSTWQRVR